MKQHITVEQLSELSDKAQKKLGEYLISKGYADYRFDLDQYPEFTYLRKLEIKCPGECDYPECHGGTLSIGQMIEFLDEHKGENIYNYSGGHMCWKRHIDTHGLVLYWEKNAELCNILWEYVKEELE